MSEPADGSWLVVSEFGFLWKPDGATCVVEVSRIATMNGRSILGVNTRDHPGLQIYTSPAGRSVRAFDVRTGRELT